MGVHWFAGTTRREWRAVVQDLADVLGDTPTHLERGGYGYHSSARVCGVSVYWSPGRADVFVVMPGEVCERLGVPALVALSLSLELVPSSRLDVAWDLEGVAVSQFAAAWHAGDVVTRAHRDSWQELRNHEGTSFYMGSRASGRMVRTYDRRGPTRLELEWKGERAEALWARLVAADEADWSREAMSELRAFLDFRKRAEGVNPQRCPLLDWWDAVTAGAGRSCVTIPRAASTLADNRAWLASQVAPVLAMVADGVEDWTAELAGLIADGRRRYVQSPARVSRVREARSEWVWSTAAD